ncbi:MAG: hypothetical protein K5855_04925 [Oscillospiraceae bacterium]|jgi:hypothetical protein|nr:hypothetical protein [Oscillospiraceae bacterium]
MARKEVFTPIWNFDGDGEKTEKKKAEKERDDAPARSGSSKTEGLDFGRGIYTDKEEERLKSFRVSARPGEEKKPTPRKTKLIIALVIILALAFIVLFLILSVKWRREAYSSAGRFSGVPLLR